jgi:hypothetical protein
VRSRVYLLLTVIGLAPLVLVGIWVADNSLGDMVDAVFANELAAAVFVDVAISALVFFYWSFGEARRLGIANWWVVIPATVFIGLCFGLPLFLYKRERAIEAGAAPS